MPTTLSSSKTTLNKFFFIICTNGNEISLYKVNRSQNNRIKRRYYLTQLTEQTWLARQIANLQVLRYGMRWNNCIIRDFFNKGSNCGLFLIKANITGPMRLIGYILFQIQIDEAEILSLGVNKFYRRGGIGTYLINLAFFEMISNGIDYTFLEVAATNRRAIYFYRHLGFDKVAIRKRYYSASRGPRLDAIVMRKSLVKQ